jgi:hypothetical protein
MGSPYFGPGRCSQACDLSPRAALGLPRLTALIANLKLGLIPLRRSTRNAKTNCSEKQALKAVLDSADQQNQSPFFQRLPTELRLAIYTFVFQSQKVLILVRSVTQTATSYVLPRHRRKQPAEAKCCAMCYEMFRSCPKLAIGGLFRACRLLYAESVSLLYSNTSFVFRRPHYFNELCKAVTINQQFTISPLRFVRDMRISVPPVSLRHYPEQIRNLYSGLTLLTEQAVTLKRFDLIQKHFVGEPVAQADLWSRETTRLLKEILRILGGFRGLERFNLVLPLFQHVGHLPGENEGFVAQEILRELVYLPKGSRAMTVRQFDNHFEARHQALVARKLARSGTRGRKLLRGRTGQRGK